MKLVRNSLVRGMRRYYFITDTGKFIIDANPRLDIALFIVPEQLKQPITSMTWRGFPIKKAED